MKTLKADNKQLQDKLNKYNSYTINNNHSPIFCSPFTLTLSFFFRLKKDMQKKDKEKQDASKAFQDEKYVHVLILVMG